MLYEAAFGNYMCVYEQWYKKNTSARKITII